MNKSGMPYFDTMDMTSLYCATMYLGPPEKVAANIILLPAGPYLPPCDRQELAQNPVANESDIVERN